MSLENDIINVIKGASMSYYSLMVNGRFVYHQDKHPVKAICSLGEDKEPTLSFAYKKSVGTGLSSYGVLPTYLAKLKSTLSDSVVAGYDFERHINSTSYEVTAYPEFYILSIDSAYFASAKQVALATNEEGMTYRFDLTLETLDRKELADFRENWFKIALLNYSYNAVLFAPRLTGGRTTFYNIGHHFLPLLIEAPFIINPFLSIMEVKDSFQKTEFWKLCERSSINYKSLRVYYISQYDICKVTGLNQFIPFDLSTALNWLCGNFSSDFPSATTRRYLLNDDTVTGMPQVLTELQFQGLEEKYRPAYISVSYLLLLCNSIFKRLGARTSRDLFEVLNKAMLK